jgi:hypothetical protein
MRRRVLFAVVLGGLVLGLLLGGCSLIPEISSTPPASEPDVVVAIGADNRTVLFDASSYLKKGTDLRFYWDFIGTGTFTEGDPIMVYCYSEAGVYFARLRVEGIHNNLSSSDTGYPGGIGGGGGGGGGGSSTKEYRVMKVDLLARNYPVIVMSVYDTWSDEVNAERIPAWHPIILDASGSYSPDKDLPLWIRWEVVYVEMEDGQWVPKPYPYECIDPDLCPKEPEYLRHEGPTFYIKNGLPGPYCGGPQAPWVYRVRIWVTDRSGRTSFKETFIRIWGY